eukprot:3226769-Amphidinium_carterae.1
MALLVKPLPIGFVMGMSGLHDPKRCLMEMSLHLTYIRIQRGWAKGPASSDIYYVKRVCKI